MKNIPKFRYLEDAVRFVRSIGKELDEYDQIIKKQHKLLAYLRTPQSWVTASLNRVNAALTVIDIVDSSKESRKRLRSLKQTIDPKLDKVVVPGIRQLKSQYSLAEDLYQKFRALESVEIQINMTFADGRDLQKALEEITKAKNKVKSQLKEIFTYLNDVANSHVPRNFQTYMDAIRSEVEEHVLFKGSSLFLYATVTDKGSITFTYYLMLEDVVNQEGELSPHMYIAVQWILGNPKEGEDPSVKIYLDYDYELPNQLMKNGAGVPVDSAQSAVRALSTMLDAESFSSSLGVIPLSLQMKMRPDQLSSNLFSYRDYINKVAVDGNTLIFNLKKSGEIGATKDAVKQISYKLYQEVRELVRRSKNTRLAMDIKQKGGNYSIVFRIIGNPEGEFSTYDAEFLKDRFGLTDTQLRKIVTILNAR